MQRAHFKIFSGSDRGLVRSHNEDSVGVVEFELSTMLAAVVADGVGGHAGGEVASKLAVDRILEYLNSNMRSVEDEQQINDRGLQQQLLNAVHEANAAIIEEQQQPGLAQMATTVVAVLLKRHQMMLAYMGDSRCYRWREHRLEQLTHDHTVAQQMIDSGDYDEEQIQHMPYHHVLNRALGLDRYADVDGRMLTMMPGDLLLLCSDGLTNCLNDEQLLNILDRHDDVHRCGEELIASANDAGGVDNISVVLIRIVD